jgi:hypothetical protein
MSQGSPRSGECPALTRRRRTCGRQHDRASTIRARCDLHFGGYLLRDVLADVPSQDFVDKGLISDAASTCFLAELIEHSRIDANGDQLARLIAERRPADAAHALQLLRG